MAHDPGAAGAVDDVDVRAELAGELVADESGDTVGASAGRPGDDELDGAAGVVGCDVVAALDRLGVRSVSASGAAGASGGDEGERGEAARPLPARRSAEDPASW
jgi:hypothetical protein